MASVEGFFALGWFGWGQAGAPGWLGAALGLGMALAAFLAMAGIVMTRRSAGQMPKMSGPGMRRRFRRIVVLEVVVLGAGTAALAAAGQYRWVPVWICFGVGVHFLALASALGERALRLLGTLLILVAAAAAVAGLTTRVTLSLITGPGAGLCLLAFGISTVLARRTARRSPSTAS